MKGVPKFVWLSEGRFLAIKPRTDSYYYTNQGAVITLRSNQWVSYAGKGPGSKWFKYGSSSPMCKIR